MAEKEAGLERQILSIRESVDLLTLKLTPYRNDIFLLSDFDIVQNTLEEYQITLKKNSKQLASRENVDLADSLDALREDVDKCFNGIEKWNEA